ncbi:succinyl-diaminopimelate desuccinylase [Jonesia quinghaiensis]|uniref:succinyl-diaminopimelate desuccinylase n=1 Tax=Jonesia quinghaiensis TaxID=262806 RepID=UPI000426FD23|nr:succinyl-diaminopimelate desuccinylase [Jonesia quinghaiensis]
MIETAHNVLAVAASSGVVALTRALCDIESVSGDEQRLADTIENWLSGFEHLTLTRIDNNVVARTNLGRDQRVIIAGHLDTVPIAQNLPTEIRTVDGQDVVWGRGTVDMKAGVAVQLALAVELTDPTYDVTWCFYANEEVEASLNGLGVVERTAPELLEADFAILGEPSNASIEGGCNGTMRAIVTTTGTAAHSARAWMGSNAIHSAAEILTRLQEYVPATVTVDGLDYREGLNATAITGGIAGNVIPDHCAVTVNYRFAPHLTLTEAERHIREVFDGFSVDIVDQAPGARPGLDAPLAQDFADAVLAVTGRQPAPKYGWTDVARFSARGIPAVNFGPGNPSLAHHDNEHCPESDITSSYSALKDWLSRS